jgi:hypothetical protein
MVSTFGLFAASPLPRAMFLMAAKAMLDNAGALQLDGGALRIAG